MSPQDRKSRIGWSLVWLSALTLLPAPVAAGQAADELYHQGKYGEAAAIYRQQMGRNPASADALAGLGRCLLRLHRPGEAAAYLSRAVQLRPADAGTKQSLARAYLDTGQTAAAQDLIESLYQSDQHDAETLFLMGESMYRSGFYERAAQAFRDALLRRDDPAARNLYAVALAKSGHLEEAERACKELLDSRANSPDLDVLLTYVQILDENGRIAEAQPYAEVAVREQPDHPIAHYWKARLLLQAARLSEAAKEAERSIALSPELPFARNLLLQIYRRMGRQEDAQRQADWLRSYDDRQAKRGFQ